jgi:hypothetical protein
MFTETKLIDQIGRQIAQPVSPAIHALADRLLRQIAQPVSPAIHALADRLLADYGDAIEAILFCGSCL